MLLFFLSKLYEIHKIWKKLWAIIPKSVVMFIHLISSRIKLKWQYIIIGIKPKLEQTVSADNLGQSSVSFCWKAIKSILCRNFVVLSGSSGRWSGTAGGRGRTAFRLMKDFFSNQRWFSLGTIVSLSQKSTTICAKSVI